MNLYFIVLSANFETVMPTTKNTTTPTTTMTSATTATTMTATATTAMPERLQPINDGCYEF